MKKAISIISIIIIVCLLGSCASVSTENGRDKPDLNISDELVPVRIFSIRYIDYAPTQEEIDSWQQYIKDRHELDVDLIYIDQVRASYGIEPVNMKTDTGVMVSDLEEFKDHEGLVFFYHISDMIKLKEAGLLKPVNEYIKNVDEYNSMNRAIIDRFTDDEGNIWAFPGNWDVGFSHRIYNKEWLDLWGKGVPYDLDSFLEYARFIAKEDPDKNGEDDTFILSYSYSNFFYDFADIFKAFGCYTNGRNAIAYNPHKEEYELITQNESFRDAIQFIISLRDENLIKSDGAFPHMGTDYDDLEFKVASDYGTGSVPLYFRGWEFGSYLHGVYETKLMKLLTSSGGFAVMRETVNADDMVRSVLGVTGKTMGYLDFDWGREGYNYEIVENLVNAITRNENDDFRAPIGIRFGPLLGNMDDTYVVQDGRIERIPVLEQYNMVEKARKSSEAHLYESGIAYSIGFEQYDNIIDKMNGILTPGIQAMVAEIMISSKTVDDAIAHFMTKAEEHDIPEQLAVFNVSLKE